MEICVVSLKLMRLKLFIPTEDLAQILFGMGQQHASYPMQSHPEGSFPLEHGAWDSSGLSWPWASSKDLPHHGDRPWRPSPGCNWTPRDLHLGKHSPFGSLAAQDHPRLSSSAALQHHGILGIWAGFILPLVHDSETLHAHTASVSRGYTDDLCCYFLWNGEYKRRCKHRNTWHRDPWDPLDLPQLRICTASASPVMLAELSARGLWRTWTPKGQWRAPLTFYWCQLLGYGYTGGEKAERHNYHLVNCVWYWISPRMSLLISVLFNHPGTQGSPRDSVFPSEWKGKWLLQEAQEHHTAPNSSLKWVAWSCY